jgi:thiol:disulfide interchange protein DsbA
MVSRGLDRKEFTDAYNSFGVTTKAKRTESELKYYSITEVPAVVVNGVYLTSPSMAAPGKKSASEAIADTLKVVEFLIDRSRKPR